MCLLFKKKFTCVLVAIVILLPIYFLCAKDSEEETGIKMTISLVEKMEFSLRQTFDILFKSYISNHAESNQIFTFLCDQSCLTENRYMYGAASSFLIAVLSDRKFSIHPKNSAALYDIYDTREYNWKRNFSNQPEVLGSFLPISQNRPLDRAKKYRLELDLQTMDFQAKLKSGNVCLQGEHNWIQDLRRHPSTSAKMPWLYRVHGSDLIRLVYNGLFELKQNVQDEIKALLTKEVGERKLVCFKGIGLGDINSSYLYENFIAGRSNSVFYFGHEFNSTSIEAILSPTSEAEIRTLRFDAKNITNSLFPDSSSKTHIGNIMEVHLLKFCDVLVTSDNPSGILAAILRRTSDGLFCLRNGKAFPCKRELIAGSFKNTSPPLEYLDIKYVSYCIKTNSC